METNTLWSKSGLKSQCPQCRQEKHRLGSQNLTHEKRSDYNKMKQWSRKKVGCGVRAKRGSGHRAGEREGENELNWALPGNEQCTGKTEGEPILLVSDGLGM